MSGPRGKGVTRMRCLCEGGILQVANLNLGKTQCIYINKDRNPSTKSTRHVKANVNT
jgi:hypothetical protein